VDALEKPELTGGVDSPDYRPAVDSDIFGQGAEGGPGGKGDAVEVIDKAHQNELVGIGEIRIADCSTAIVAEFIYAFLHMSIRKYLMMCASCAADTSRFSRWCSSAR
jgi:hypothetical protein